MSYFKTPLGAAFDKSRFMQTAMAVTNTAGVATPQSIALDKLKAGWPRCVINGKLDPNFYLYKFADGRTRCTRGWSQENYAMVVKGTSPTIAPPDLSKVVPGSAEYFKWLCRAQGEGSDLAVQAVRIGFDKANLTWTPTVDSKMRNWTGYPSAPHPKILPQNINTCAAYANKGTAIKDWEFRAYDYSVNVQGKEPQGKRPGGLAPAQEHRASQCEGKVPPELVEACKAALAKNDGTSIETFERQVNSMSPAELEQLVYGGAAAGAAMPTPPPMGIPPVLLYGGIAAAVGLVAFVALKGKKA